MAERKEPPGKERKELGIAVVGSGRIGTLRASLAASHPAVRFLAVSDMDLSRARTLADRVNAQFFSDNNLEVMSRPEVNAVIVSTSEHEHTLPVLQALELNCYHSCSPARGEEETAKYKVSRTPRLRTRRLRMLPRVYYRPG